MLHNVDCTLCDLSLDFKGKNNYMLHTRQFTEQQSAGLIYCWRISLKEKCPTVDSKAYSL